jgi:hypothetical protein
MQRLHARFLRVFAEMFGWRGMIASKRNRCLFAAAIRAKDKLEKLSTVFQHQVLTW